jgi:hypothetical protein
MRPKSVILLFIATLLIASVSGAIATVDLGVRFNVRIVLYVIAFFFGGIAAYLGEQYIMPRLLGRVLNPHRRLSDSDNRRPPKFAEYLLYPLLPKKDRDPLLGDLEEEYQDIRRQFGARRAGFWYYWQVGASIGPLLVRAINKLVRWGILTWLGNVIRRLIS